MDPVNSTLEASPMYKKNPCVVHVPILPDAWGYILSQIPGPPHTSSNPTGAFAGIDLHIKNEDEQGEMRKYECTRMLPISV